jgi:hypothetical protein
MNKILGALLLFALLTRGSLDLLWWVTLPGVRSLGALVTTGIIVACAVLVGSRREHVPRSLGVPFALFGVLVIAGFGRGPGTWLDAIRWALLYLGPLIFGTAVWVVRPSPQPWIRSLLVAATVPLLASVALLIAGQPQDLVLHGYPRLLGPFKNHHNLAVFASGLCLVSGYASTQERGAWRAVAVAVGLASAICLALTYVRTCWILVGGTVALWAIFEKRWSLLAFGTLTATGALAISPTLQERFSDIAHVLSGVPPTGGWRAIGSSRVHIWTDSFAHFWAGGGLSFVWGNGLGGHMNLHKDLDPHCEYLSLLYQLGIAAPLTYLWIFAAAARASFRDQSSLGRWVTAAVIMTAATCLISNDYLGRTTFAWGLWAGVALAGANATKHSGDRRRQDERRPDAQRLGELGRHVR